MHVMSSVGNVLKWVSEMFEAGKDHHHHHPNK